MGHRTLKRVPLNFRWPIGKLWKGYVNPYPGPRICEVCDGGGYNAATKKIADEYYDHEGYGVRWRYIHGIAPDGTPTTRPPWKIVGKCLSWEHDITQDEVEALVAEHRLMEFTHTWTQDHGWQPKAWETKGFWCPKCHIAVPQLSTEHHSGFCNACDQDMLLLPENDIRLHIPWAEEVNRWSHHGFGHDSFNSLILIKARAKRLGVFGECSACNGSGESKLPRKMKKRYRNWKEYEPPTGEGFQLWETCSEGSPESPVFESAEALAEWCESNANLWSENDTLPRERWLRMFTGEEDLENGSLGVAERGTGYVGAMALAPR
ncbi:MAG: hypothetical protein JWN50_727 [Parcubacteria group bacterium]|nr:hypothetical protein [Parcubacteria group bacterium]